jgi:hypothetical protein
MTLDDVLLKALEGGEPLTVRDIAKRLETPVHEAE